MACAYTAPVPAYTTSARLFPSRLSLNKLQSRRCGGGILQRVSRLRNAASCTDWSVLDRLRCINCEENVRY
mgnify:CR=1 FL=1